MIPRWLLCLALFLPAAGAYTPAVDSAGSLTIRILDPTIGNYGAGGAVTLNRTGAPFPLAVSLENHGDGPLQGVVRISVIDRWTVQPASPVSFRLKAHASRALEFTVTVGQGSFNANYPIHAYAEFGQDGQRLAAHAVMVLPVVLPDPPRAQLPVQWKPVDVPAGSAMGLARLPVNRVSATVSAADPPIVPTPGESFGVAPPVRFSGDAIVMSLGPRAPSFRERVDSAAVEYPLALPHTTPIRLTFSGAGSGTMLRVRVDDTVVFEKSGSAEPETSSVDLSRYAGRDIRLALAAQTTEPGARQASWSEPFILAGTEQRNAALPVQILRAGNFAVRIQPGLRGMLDGTIQFSNGGGTLEVSGFRVHVVGDALEGARSTNKLVEVRNESANGRVAFRQRFRGWAGSFDLVCEIWPNGDAVQARWKLENQPPPKPWLPVYLESVAAGPWSASARRVYAGVGNVIEKPGAFQMGFDGHRLATSFVGFEFENGLSMVQGVDTPPDYLDVEPATRSYSLVTPHEQTMTFIPTTNVWAGVKVWRDLCGARRGGGVERLAGRFVFDLWDGRYGQSAKDLAKAFRYGLTDSVVVWHNWQRWGYDYRLPDIYPPNPQYGTTEEFAALVRVCKDHGVLFAPHDNYIDFYPDADGFTYDNIAFDRDGQPRRAWYHAARQAQSYRARADRLRPFLERNVKMIAEGIAPDAYFIDVWSSMGPYDYWSADGQFFSRTVTRQVWRDSFAWIRDYLGGAPQISEAGHDQLIGWLDGAQANHLRVEAPPASGFVWVIPHADAERIPWFDAAYHDRFASHGAGYEDRYAAGLDLKEHGMYSRDYISTEVLTGHPAMVRQPFGREVVRIYWLLHDLMRALAMRKIDGVEFDGGSLHRQHVSWEGGGEVWVNRGASEWSVAAHILPQYGFYARIPVSGGVVETAIETRAGTVVEWSRSPEAFYQGEYRVARGVGSIEVTPLPSGPAFEARINTRDLPWTIGEPKTAEVVDEAGRVLRSEPVALAGGVVTLRFGAGAFRWRLR